MHNNLTSVYSHSRKFSGSYYSLAIVLLQQSGSRMRSKPCSCRLRLCYRSRVLSECLGPNLREHSPTSVPGQLLGIIPSFRALKERAFCSAPRPAVAYNVQKEWGGCKYCLSTDPKRGPVFYLAIICDIILHEVADEYYLSGNLVPNRKRTNKSCDTNLNAIGKALSSFKSKLQYFSAG